jgi:hypothetical protein
LLVRKVRARRTFSSGATSARWSPRKEFSMRSIIAILAASLAIAGCDKGQNAAPTPAPSAHSRG